ncbi:hypothetical protein GJ496_004426 [Pomphorhynchus laevis]|nr:hypothetical protein GJ496_004426 [Pomphorhynchus laevis]
MKRAKSMIDSDNEEYSDCDSDEQLFSETNIERLFSNHDLLFKTSSQHMDLVNQQNIKTRSDKDTHQKNYGQMLSKTPVNEDNYDDDDNYDYGGEDFEDASPTPTNNSSKLDTKVVDSSSQETCNYPAYFQDKYHLLLKSRFPKLLDNSHEQDETNKLQVLFANFSEEQLNQYEMYRRATFPKSLVRRIVQSTLGINNVSQNVIIAIAGITKVFVGEIIEKAIELRGNRSKGPLLPRHIFAAYRKVSSRNIIKPSTYYIA